MSEPPRSPNALTRWRQALVSKFTIRQVVGSVLTTVAFALTLLLALLGAGERPPSLGSALAIAVVAGVLQFSGAWMFSGRGKADPTLAQSAARKLFVLGARSANMTAGVERLFEGDLPQEQRVRLMGELSVQASYIQEDVEGAIADWRLFHRDAVSAAQEEMMRDG